MFILKYIPHLIAYYLCPTDLSINICMRVSINPRIYLIICYQPFILGCKCTIQDRTFMLWGNNLKSRQMMSHNHNMFCSAFSKVLFDIT